MRCHGNMTSLIDIFTMAFENTCTLLTVVIKHLYMFENDVRHNLQFKMAAYVMEGITSSVCTQTVQAMDYTCNMKGSLSEVLRASLTVAIILLKNITEKKQLKSRNLCKLKELRNFEKSF